MSDAPPPQQPPPAGNGGPPFPTGAELAALQRQYGLCAEAGCRWPAEVWCGAAGCSAGLCYDHAIVHLNRHLTERPEEGAGRGEERGGATDRTGQDN